MTTIENSTAAVDETTDSTEAHPDGTEDGEEFALRNRHQTIVPVDEESPDETSQLEATLDASEVGPAENRHQTVLPGD